jgi:precorrin-6B methylase 2
LRKIFLDPRTEEAILQASESDPYQLSLTLRDFPAKDRIFIATQVEARQKARDKIPEFYNRRKVLFPSAVAVEQASSSKAARYKSRLIKGGTLIDLTGGLGVDAYFFSRSAEKVIYVERDGNLTDFADHNFHVLGVKNIEVIHGDGIEYIQHSREKPACIYVDPSRRQGSKRIYRIEEAEPDVSSVYQELLKLSGRMVIKLSPLIDIRYLIQHFQFIKEIHVLAIEQDCREVILVLDSSDFSDDPAVITCSIEGNLEQIFITSWKKNETKTSFELPQRFIYDPNVAIRKSGLFNALGHRFNLKKLAPNSHLFTGNEYVDSFPGRAFHLSGILSMKEFFRTKSIRKANIAARNFPLKVNEIRKRTGIRDGGEMYVFCTSNLINEPVVLLTYKAETKK